MSNANAWDSVTVIRKRPANATAQRSEAALNAARRAGGAIETTKKFNGPNHRASGMDAGKAAKVDNETEVTYTRQS